MRPAKLGELAAMALLAAVCLSYAVMARAQPPVDSASASGRCSSSQSEESES
jgi:hypothetical protein